ncbi:MAG TPA: ankyrin repeat domain-containing protein [Polyangium sp.]|nr:ankyrin repeat domain-containing protein [Polyangium sp.]
MTRQVLNDALFAAIDAGDLVRVRTTLDAGANVNAERPYKTNIDREVLSGTESALLVAARYGHEPIVRLLLERFASTHTADSLTGRTALVEACVQGRLPIVETLLSFGANPSARDALAGQNCLTLAIANGYGDIARALVRACAQVEPRALEEACRRGRLDMAELCVDAGLDVRETEAFKNAAMAGQTEALRWLVKQGVDVKKQGPAALLDGANAGNSEAVQSLLEMGVPVDSRTDYGWTALHLAAYNGNAATVEVLVKAGADVRADDGSGKTPLDWAREMGKVENVKVLENLLAAKN